jgi:hypothetical protein
MSDTAFKYQPVLHRTDLKNKIWDPHKFVRPKSDHSGP